ncbi:ATP-binding protein [Salinivibrio sp. YCSC6]|uniref:ATP-binding protein n=1 Tax=Salinivibrio sp. YCSC6 TaxID=2003370 RepID=UPI000BBC1323|nr:ATP-binding protein [Salinivibrio sp. YCSC6]PCE67490.1 hypothetical protein B6G00_03780 [Salinivibrio sp. YCSC6]QCF35605.1 HAMP domain-containing protein [Salinivibrio sp. YCSC6]
MRRIYLEFFFSLIIVFVTSIVTYVGLVSKVTDDHDAIFLARQADGLVDILDVIEATSGTSIALEALDKYIEKVEFVLETYQAEALPDQVSAYFNQVNRPLDVFYDHDDKLWFHLADKDTFYAMQENTDSPLHIAIAFEDNLLIAFLCGGFAVYSFFMVWFLSRRVRALERTTLQFAGGDLNARASIRSHQRVGSLNRTFNHMADRIANLVSSSRALTNAVAHELRTPVFRIQWQAELLSESALDNKQQQKVASIIEDTDEMASLVDELLYLARVDHPNTLFTPQTLEASVWMKEQWPRWQTLSTKSMSLDAPQDLPRVEADPHLLKRVITNLIGNAEKYATSQIAVRVYCEDTQLVIAVHDDGEGVESSHWPFIFDAFYSADRSRDKKRSGYGLGLAIVKQIVIRHGGHVEIDHSDLGGACFRVILPLQT